MPTILRIRNMAKVRDTILSDINDFYFGDARPIYLWETELVNMGTLSSGKKGLAIKFYDEPMDIMSYPRTSVQSRPDLISAYYKAHTRDQLCCSETMLEQGVGFGCAHDIDNILQMAIFGEVVY